MKKTARQLAAVAKGIKLLVVDVDGVMTDGSIVLDNEGNELKRFHVRDGHGLKMVQRAGVQVAIVTGRTSKVVEYRAKELGIAEVHQGCKDKRLAYRHILEKLGVKDSEVAFIGDDVVDIPLLVRAGLPIVVADAVEAAKAYAAMVTKNPGGRGAVREVTDFLLKSKGLWDGAIEKYAQV
jgi:3-deoxy-D-manno-octulosonate 8-phosphate phosphatase (KDO 8-P phosphatase)